MNLHRCTRPAIAGTLVLAGALTFTGRAHAADCAGQGKSIQRVGHRARVKLCEPGESVSHSTPGPPDRGHYDQ